MLQGPYHVSLCCTFSALHHQHTISSQLPQTNCCMVTQGPWGEDGALGQLPTLFMLIYDCYTRHIFLFIGHFILFNILKPHISCSAVWGSITTAILTLPLPTQYLYTVNSVQYLLCAISIYSPMWTSLQNVCYWYSLQYASLWHLLLQGNTVKIVLHCFKVYTQLHTMCITSNVQVSCTAVNIYTLHIFIFFFSCVHKWKVCIE